jgi:predicted glycosyltransferase involved in capsule biosynthesis
MKPTFIIPYRNRKEHLQRLAPHLLPIGEVVVIEQADNRPFNRGKLLNIGFAIARETMDYCIFHDVDMIPIDPACYRYNPDAVTHLAGCCTQFGMKMPYPEYLGGVTMFNPIHFEDINGFSNDFWGWGGEDDDLRNRVLEKGIQISNYPGKFKSLYHRHNYEQKTHEANLTLLGQGPDFESGLSTLTYESITQFNFQFSPDIQAYSVIL